jgi:hypothetical protein
MGAARGAPDVTIRVPSDYVSQQASTLDVTLVRSARRQIEHPLTVHFTAAPGPLSNGDSALNLFTPVDELITFPAGQTSEMVAVPINASAANPGLVPILMTVTAPNVSSPASQSTVYLASGPDSIPPSIVSVHMATKGIAVTFSKPMAPATVQNLHNYAVKHAPSQDFSLLDLTGVGLVRRLNNTAQTVPLRRAVYDPSTNTVTLIPTIKLPSSGTYEISSAPSLLSKRARPHKAQPLADLTGHVLNPGATPVPGAFSITIRRGHPYASSTPILSDGR